MNELIVLFSVICSMGYGFHYDGKEEGKHYVQVNTPDADYGLVLEKDKIYCDMVVHQAFDFLSSDG
jgi:hypothetical protein